MTTQEFYEEASDPAPAMAEAPVQKTWREQRQARRRRRVWFEEILAWILVPVIVIGAYWLVEFMLGALGTSIPQVIAGLQAIASGKVAP